jgi:hypothetical protein
MQIFSSVNQSPKKRKREADLVPQLQSDLFYQQAVQVWHKTILQPRLLLYPAECRQYMSISKQSSGHVHVQMVCAEFQSPLETECYKVLCDIVRLLDRHKLQYPAPLIRSLKVEFVSQLMALCSTDKHVNEKRLLDLQECAHEIAMGTYRELRGKCKHVESKRGVSRTRRKPTQDTTRYTHELVRLLSLFDASSSSSSSSSVSSSSSSSVSSSSSSSLISPSGSTSLSHVFPQQSPTGSEQGSLSNASSSLINHPSPNVQSTPATVHPSVSQTFELYCRTFQPVSAKKQEEILKKYTGDNEGKTSTVECGICLDESIMPLVTPCLHVFCTVCFLRWASTKYTCPLCRKEMYHLEPLKSLHRVTPSHRRMHGGSGGASVRKRQLDVCSSYKAHSSVLTYPSKVVSLVRYMERRLSVLTGAMAVCINGVEQLQEVIMCIQQQQGPNLPYCVFQTGHLSAALRSLKTGTRIVLFTPRTIHHVSDLAPFLQETILVSPMKTEIKKNQHVLFPSSSTHTGSKPSSFPDVYKTVFVMRSTHEEQVAQQLALLSGCTRIQVQSSTGVVDMDLEASPQEEKGPVRMESFIDQVVVEHRW